MSLPNPPPTPSISPTMSIVVTQPPQNPSSVLPSLAPTINTTNTTNGSGGNSDGGRSRGASYFFGFLIAFIALLLFFIGCGVGARRRLLNRRRRLHVFFGDINNSGDVPWFAADANASLDGFFGRDNDAKLEDIKEPLFWDRGFSKGGEFWDSMIPLAASVVQEDSAVESSSGGQTQRWPYRPSNWLQQRQQNAFDSDNAGVDNSNGGRSTAGTGTWLPWYILSLPIRGLRLRQRQQQQQQSPSALPPGPTQPGVPLTTLSSPSSVPSHVPIPMPAQGDHRQLSHQQQLQQQQQQPPLQEGIMMKMKTKMHDPTPPMTQSQVQVVVTILMPSRQYPTSEKHDKGEKMIIPEMQLGVMRLPVLWNTGELA